MADTLSIVSLVSYIIAAVSFALAVIFWFVFKIPTVIGDLSGRNARKSIAKMRENNEKTGNKSYRSSTVNANRGKLTDTMQDSGKLDKDKKINVKKEETTIETGLLAENRATSYDSEQTGLLEESEDTALLNDSEETGMLTDMEETGMLDDTEETGLLTDENETVLLSEEVPVRKKRVGGVELKMIEEVMLIHTDETI